MEFSNDTTVRIYFRPWGKERVETANCRAEVNTWCGQGWLIPHVKYSGAPSFFLLRQIREVPTKKLKICWRGFRGLDARGGGRDSNGCLAGVLRGARWMGRLAITRPPFSLWRRPQNSGRTMARLWTICFPLARYFLFLTMARESDRTVKGFSLCRFISHRWISIGESRTETLQT